jgi:ABC-type ATPase with predicted acetyltransferase domain
MDLNIVYKTNIINPSERILKVADAFGVGIDETHKQIIVENLTIPEFNVLYLTGMSGSGKSSLLNEFKKEYDFEEPVIDKESDTPIIDTIGKDLNEALYLLNLVGLGEAFLYVKPYKILSDGQKYRYQIAKLIESNQNVWCIDEFCSFLDRTTAKIVSYNIQKIARRLHKKLIVATAHNDLQEDLQADYVFDFGMGEGLVIERNHYENKNPFIHNIKIEEGNIEDYKKLGKYHYKNTEARFTKYIFKMTYLNMLIGVAVYSMPKQQLVGRNVYFNKKYVNEKGVPILKEVNKDILTGSRFIIHPMFRGIGLGVELVKRTACLVDRPYIEIVSAMSKYNKFLEKAGATYVCNNLTEEKIKKEKKIKDLFHKYNLDYEFIASPRYCQKVLDIIPEGELKNAIYGVLRPNYFNNRARFKKYGINFQTKKEFMEIKLIPELIELAKWATTEYYIWEN